MSDRPRDQESEGNRTLPDPADEPTTGPPAGASTPPSPAPGISTSPGTAPGISTSPGTAPGTGTSAGTAADASTPAGRARGAGTSAGPAAGATAGTGTFSAPGSGGATAAGTRRPWRARGPAVTLSEADDAGPEEDARRRRRRRYFLIAISLGAALIVISLCVGGLSVIHAFRSDAAEGREDRGQRDRACLELETRLNRLTPPGATDTPGRRAVAVRDENAATRIYIGQVRDQRVGDGWRQLVDARTSFAEGLDAQAKSRTPAFFVAPVSGDGVPVADQLARGSPESCAGPIRRLAGPDL